jgi:dolichol kinase
MGVLLAIVTFAIVFCLLILFSRFKLITDYFILNCRKKENKYSFLVNTIATLLILFILFLLFHNKPAIFVAGGLVISWADAAGEIIGRKIPSKRYKLFSEKSVAGSIAVFLFSCISFLFSGFYFAFSPSFDWIWKILLGGLFCSCLEAFSWKWLDNLFLPPIACLIMLWIQL